MIVAFSGYLLYYLFTFGSLEVTYIGKPSHAAGFPWEGINALDAAVMCYNSIACLRQQMKPDWRVHCKNLQIF